MAETTPNLKLIIPEAPGANPNEPFDWNEFIRNNWMKVDAMKVLGDTRIINAAEYVINNRFRWDTLISDAANDGDLSKGMVIYFPPGRYPIADSNHPTQGIEFGINESIKALWLLGAKGAIIDGTGATGDQITAMMTVQDIEDVVIQGLTFIGKADTVANTGTLAIRLRHVTNAAVDSVKIENVAYGIALDKNASDPSRKVWVTRNYIKDYNKIGININEALNVIVRDNIITRDTEMIEPGDLSLGHGIQIKPGSTSESHSYAIIGNHIINPRRNGIELLDGTGAYVVEIVDNTIDKPGNFSSPGDQLAKATRGSGIRSELTGRLVVIHNVIREPLSHGIMLNGVSDLATTRIEGNNIVMGFDRGDLNGLSWHAIAIEEVPQAHVANNTIRLGTPSRYSFQGEVRRSIRMDDGNGAVITNNTIEGGGGVYITDSDDVIVSANRIDMTDWNYTCIDIFGSDGATCHKPVVIGNSLVTGAGPCIRVVGGASFAQDPVVIGNDGDVSVPVGSYANRYDRVMGNKPATGGLGGIIDTPHFSISDHGLVERGRYQEADFIRPGALYAVSPAVLTMENSNHYPVISFPDGAAAGYAYVAERLMRYDYSDDGDDITVDVLFSTTTGASGPAYIELGYILSSYTSEGTAYKSDSWTTISAVINVTDGLKYARFSIPKASIPTAKKMLLLRVMRNPANSNDTLAAPLYVHGLRLLWRAQHAGYEAY